MSQFSNGLARPVGAEEAGDPSGPDDEGGFVDRNRMAVALGEVLRLDHRSSFPRAERF
jgi:hypothetical protein